MRQMVVAYPDRLLVEQLDDVYVLSTAPFRIFVQEEGQPTYVITVPANFKSDYASVPKFPGIYERLGWIGKKAAYGHDFTYDKQFDPVKSRAWCDAVFHHGLLATGISEVNAEEMYLGVRLGGESHWKTE